MQTKAAVIDAEIAVSSANDSIRPDQQHLLGHHADVDLIAPLVAIAIEGQAIVKPSYLLNREAGQ